MKKVLSLVLSIVILISFIPLAFANVGTGYMQKEKIKVGVCADFKPFEYYDENGNLTGFDIELMNYISQRSDFEIEFVNMYFDEIFQGDFWKNTP